MSAGTVRAALKTFFATPQIPGVEAIYADQPWIALGGDWNLSQNLGYGAVGWLHLNSETESRIALPALGGSKHVEYQVGLVLLYQYVIPDRPSVTALGDEDSWVGPLDTIIDGVKARIRSDPTMGTGAGGAIFEGGQSANDIKISRDLPRKDNGKVWAWQVVEFTVTEIITA